MRTWIMPAAFLFCVTACSDYTEDYFITLENASENILMIGLSETYPEDSTTIFWRTEESHPGSFINSHDYYRINMGGCKMSTWYIYFYESEKYHAGYWSITIVDANHNSAKRWEIEDYEDVLVRYDLKREDLERLHWTISYPPTEAMKDIHMYPPYETFETKRP